MQLKWTVTKADCLQPFACAFVSHWTNKVSQMGLEQSVSKCLRHSFKDWSYTSHAFIMNIQDVYEQTRQPIRKLS